MLCVTLVLWKMSQYVINRETYTLVLLLIKVTQGTKGQRDVLQVFQVIINSFLLFYYFPFRCSSLRR